MNPVQLAGVSPTIALSIVPINASRVFPTWRNETCRSSRQTGAAIVLKTAPTLKSVLHTCLKLFFLSLSCKWIFSFPFSLIRHSLLWHLQFKEKKRAKKKVFKRKIASQVCSPLVFRVFSRCVFHYWNEVLFLILRLGVFKMNCAILHLQICVVKMQMFCICVVKYLNTYWMNEIFEGVFFSNLLIFFH